MVYDLLAITTRHVKLAIEGPNGGYIKLVIHEVAVQILAVSRQVNSEASAIMLPRLAQMTILPQLILSCDYNDHGELISWGGGREGNDKICDLALVAGSNPYYYTFGKDISYASKWVSKLAGENEKRAVEQWVRVARRNMYLISGKLDRTFLSFRDIPLQFLVEDRDDLDVVADLEQWKLAASMFFRGYCSLGRECKVRGLARPILVNGEGEVSGRVTDEILMESVNSTITHYGYSNDWYNSEAFEAIQEGVWEKEWAETN
jgi:hypothetical protein